MIYISKIYKMNPCIVKNRGLAVVKFFNNVGDLIKKR